MFPGISSIQSSDRQCQVAAQGILNVYSTYYHAEISSSAPDSCYCICNHVHKLSHTPCVKHILKL